LVVAGVLLIASALLARLSARVGVPVFMLFLAVGMLAGSDGIGQIALDDYELVFRFSTVALALILFDGGLNTSIVTFRKALGPATVLATVGVLLTAAIVAGLAWLLGLSLPLALLLGAVVSSTDAAAVFSVLRSSGIRLRDRVGATLEIESGLNDPAAILLTTLVMAWITSPDSLGLTFLWMVVLQLVVGVAGGCVIGWLGRWMLTRTRLPVAGLAMVITTGIALLAFGIPTLLAGSGFLSVYVAALVLGNTTLPYRASLMRVHDALAWLAQVSMFLLLGLLVFPSRLMEVAGVGLLLGLGLALIARPLAAGLCLLPFRFRRRELAAVSWIGLRGAVPIVLATLPVMAAVEGAERLFDLVFFIVVVSSVIPGATVALAARKLGVTSNAPPPPQAVLEITSLQSLEGDILQFVIRPGLAAAGATIHELPMPAGTTAMLIVRGRELIGPRGPTRLEVGDHLFLFCRREDRDLIELIFGAAVE
jgi:cell volume regulation protein A